MIIQQSFTINYQIRKKKILVELIPILSFAVLLPSLILFLIFSLDSEKNSLTNQV